MDDIEMIVNLMRKNNYSLSQIAAKLIRQNDIISYAELCLREGGRTVQKGMNFRFSDPYSVILMSTRKGAPYDDSISNDGKTLEYEGHDAKNDKNKEYDQPRTDNNGNLTENGRFCQAIDESKNRGEPCSEKVRVYEKIRTSVWAFRGVFLLRDYKYVKSKGRMVFKFILEITDDNLTYRKVAANQTHNRIIPSGVMREVYVRDGGKCAKCGATTNLHYDHILPYSKGGSSKTPKNIQILCEKCNLAKTNHIENGID